MTRRLKVYGGAHVVGNKCVRAIIAAHNAQEVASALGNASAYYVRGYWSVTGNAKEIEVAMSQPGILFVENPQSREYAASQRS
jgi:hypothetical protein